MSLRSTIDLLARYRRTRLPLRIVAPLVVLVCAAALAGGRPGDAASALLMVCTACTLVLQFRLWDDLADLPADRLAHPERVLASAASLAPFRTTLVALMFVNLILLGGAPKPWPRLCAFALLNASFAAWYHARAWQDRLRSPLINAHVVLAKYPVFVALLAAGPPVHTPLMLATAAVYLCLAVHELLHDSRLASRPTARTSLTVDLAGLGAVAAMSLTLRSPI